MATLKYTTREINRNYKIKVSGIYDGAKVNTLVGVTGLVRMVDDIELTNRLLDRAFACMGEIRFLFRFPIERGLWRPGTIVKPIK